VRPRFGQVFLTAAEPGIANDDSTLMTAMSFFIE
jgi:hypothetical protein